MRRYWSDMHAPSLANLVSLVNVWIECLTLPPTSVCVGHMDEITRIMGLRLTSNSAGERR